MLNLDECRIDLAGLGPLTPHMPATRVHNHRCRCLYQRRMYLTTTEMHTLTRPNGTLSLRVTSVTHTHGEILMLRRWKLGIIHIMTSLEGSTTVSVVSLIPLLIPFFLEFGGEARRMIFGLGTDCIVRDMLHKFVAHHSRLEET